MDRPCSSSTKGRKKLEMVVFKHPNMAYRNVLRGPKNTIDPVERDREERGRASSFLGRA